MLHDLGIVSSSNHAERLLRESQKECKGGKVMTRLLVNKPLLCSAALLVGFVGGSLGAYAQETEESMPQTRPFYMGFSDWDFGTTEEHKMKTYELIGKHSDFICLQFMDGVPWPEAYAGEHFGKALQKVIDDRLAALKEDRKVYLEVSLLNMNRTGLAGYIGEEGGMGRPAPWDNYDLEDEQVSTAYANYCNRLIEAFKPDYLNYVLEGADYRMDDPEARQKYLDFLDTVYHRIKEKHPEVPLGISATIHDPERAATQEYKDGIAKLLPYVDWLGASFYPFAFYRRDDAGNPNTLPKPSIGLIESIAQGKPVAFTETNWPAEDLIVEGFDLNVESSAEWQKDYARDLLQAAHEVDALFVVWWAIADWHLKWESFPDDVKDIGKIWRDTGLLDQNLNPRPALEVWDRWLALPVAK